MSVDHTHQYSAVNLTADHTRGKCGRKVLPSRGLNYKSQSEFDINMVNTKKL